MFCFKFARRQMNLVRLRVTSALNVSQLRRAAQGWFYFRCAPESYNGYSRFLPAGGQLSLSWPRGGAQRQGSGGGSAHQHTHQHLDEASGDGGGALGGGVCAVEREVPVYGESRQNSAASHARSTTTHILTPSAMSGTDCFERDGAGAVVHGGVVQVWEGDEAYRLSREAMAVIMERYTAMTGRHRADHRLGVGVVRDSRGVALTRKDRERAVDASRSTDQNSNSTTPHVARAGAPRESAEWCACVARGAGVGLPAKPLRLVAPQTQRAVRRRNPHRVRAHLPRAPHARLGGLRRSGIARRGRFAHGQSQRRLRERAPSRRVLCALPKPARRYLSGGSAPRGAKSRALTYSLTYQSPRASIYFHSPTSSRTRYRPLMNLSNTTNRVISGDLGLDLKKRCQVRNACASVHVGKLWDSKVNKNSPKVLQTWLFDERSLRQSRTAPAPRAASLNNTQRIL
ncbi:hypothetical protein FB451DRAFT_1175216 [Mycena latifolia]|nr:hypothetical protein FB451DRAFT_1175216 [Mycena latifolia]